jgi:hypothetical protein
MAQIEAGTREPEGIAAEIEAHSIDIIPDNERRGNVRGQFTLWFATNANVFNFVLGGFAIAFGLNVFWALIALFTGTLLGMVFTALHAVQGPRLGVPQKDHGLPAPGHRVDSPAARHAAQVSAVRPLCGPGDHGLGL